MTRTDNKITLVKVNFLRKLVKFYHKGNCKFK